MSVLYDIKITLNFFLISQDKFFRAKLLIYTQYAFLVVFAFCIVRNSIRKDKNDLHHYSHFKVICASYESNMLEITFNVRLPLLDFCRQRTF